MRRAAAATRASPRRPASRVQRSAAGRSTATPSPRASAAAKASCAGGITAVARRDSNSRRPRRDRGARPVPARTSRRASSRRSPTRRRRARGSRAARDGEVARGIGRQPGGEDGRRRAAPAGRRGETTQGGRKRRRASPRCTAASPRPQQADRGVALEQIEQHPRRLRRADRRDRRRGRPAAGRRRGAIAISCAVVRDRRGGTPPRPPGACRGSRRRRAAAGPPRRCGSRRWSRASAPAARAPSRDSTSPRSSRQTDAPAPRPTRPRSWWSWARPKRSARLDDHQRRVGHVDADLDHRRRDEHAASAPLANAAITASLSGPFIRPWTSPTASPKRARSARRARRRRRLVAGLAPLDQRADPIGLAAAGEMAARAPATTSSIRSPRQHARVDRLAAGRQLVEPATRPSRRNAVSASVRGIGVAVITSRCGGALGLGG